MNHPTSDVRERLGPLIEKLKSNVRVIRALENSIQSSSCNENVGVSKENGETAAALPSTISNDGHSRMLMQESIDMVKRKMLRLKLMEEDLAVLDERRLSLHNHVQQQLVAKPAAVPPSPSHKAPTNHEARIAELEEENRLLREKAGLVDSLRAENARLVEQTKDVELLESTLDAERSLRQKLELDVEVSQHKLDQQADKYDCLSRKFEVLTSTIANLTRVLQSEENSNLSLEQSIMEAMRNLSKGNLPETIGRPGENDSVATELTTLTWTESSIWNDDLSSAVDKSSFYKKEAEGQTPTVETLETVIESLNHENAELRERKSDAINENNSLREERKLQDTVIEGLRQKLDSEASTPRGE